MRKVIELDHGAAIVDGDRFCPRLTILKPANGSGSRHVPAASVEVGGFEAFTALRDALTEVIEAQAASGKE